MSEEHTCEYGHESLFDDVPCQETAKVTIFGQWFCDCHAKQMIEIHRMFNS